MISCFLQGGLGNQMFQIAATVSHAIKNKTEYGINFNLCETPNQGNSANKYKNNFFKNIKRIDHSNFEHIYNEPSFSYKPIPFQDNTILKGYFQSEKYFNENKNEIKKLFEFPSSYKQEVNFFLKKNNLLDKNVTTIHVRRGDYLKFSNFHEVCTLDYFIKSTNLFTDSYFVIVTDDKKWVNENLKLKNSIISDLKDELSDMCLMSMSDNLIISNSSFSWWGAYLNQKKTKLVISPYKWFGPNGPKDTEDIFMKNWIKLEF